MSNQYNHQQAIEKYGLFFCVFLALTILAGIAAPRLMGYMPAITGLIFFSFHCYRNRCRPLIIKEVFYWMALIAALAALSHFWAVAPDTALERSGKMALVLLPGALLLSLSLSLPVQQYQTILWLLLGAFMIGGLYLVIELCAGMPVYHLTHEIPEGALAIPDFLNRSVIVTILLAPVILYLSRYLTLPDFLSRRARTLITIALIGLMMLVFIGTLSQSAQLCLVIMVAVFVCFPYRHKIAWYGLMALLVAAIMGAPFLSLWLFDHLAGTVDTIPLLGPEYAYAANRLEIWDFISRYALQNPLYGFGIEATRAITDFDTQQLYHRSNTALHPHNFALQLWIEFGVIGALLGSALIVRLIWTIKNLDIVGQKLALPVLAGCLSVGAMSYGLWQGWWLGFMIFLLTLINITLKVLPAQKETP